MTTPNVHAVAERLVAYLETGTPAQAVFTDDVFLDFTMPCWRLQAEGLDAALALRRRGHPMPGHVPRWRVDPTPGGFVIELEERWTDADSDWYCREMMRAQLRGESICALSVYCTGDWDTKRQAEHRAQVRLSRP